MGECLQHFKTSFKNIYLKLFQAKDVETIHSSLSQHSIDPEYTRACFILKITNLPVTSLSTLREESSQTNVILQYNVMASILSAVCHVIQQS